MMWASVTPNFNFDWLRYLVRRNSGELYSAKGLFLDFLGNRGSLEEEDEREETKNSQIIFRLRFTNRFLWTWYMVRARAAPERNTALLSTSLAAAITAPAPRGRLCTTVPCKAVLKERQRHSAAAARE